MRLIDADMAERLVGCDEFTETLEMMETEDAAPVVHAEWIVIDRSKEGNEFYGFSNCRNVVSIVKPTWKYCPHCGAKMGEEVEEDG